MHPRRAAAANSVVGRSLCIYPIASVIGGCRNENDPSPGPRTYPCHLRRFPAVGELASRDLFFPMFYQFASILSTSKESALEEPSRILSLNS